MAQDAAREFTLLPFSNTRGATFNATAAPPDGLLRRGNRRCSDLVFFVRVPFIRDIS
jgi:hypothetical protein